ncbi:receptor-type tyrosine-protein phosphatase R-like isoform X4 [Carcharodon carcharias]|uniref:receptor-type tyrosine-protein phosphatase R-like isoform X4 n=1 Tax=Carcharodon carcharias TaxID=13397 RepID=UPI001B7E9866|nr:receptor-type tyrosine-protein phosphatase R-like isoform X4 [Carcharodon carcharias]
MEPAGSLSPDLPPSEVCSVHSMVQPGLASIPIHTVSCQGQPAKENMDPSSTFSASFKSVKQSRLQERRGSNVSLTLDVSALGNIEPIKSTPQEITLLYLKTSSCLLNKEQLKEATSNIQALEAEFSGYEGKEKAYIATQGPMVNTVNDFWEMVWQENCPIIVMITKLKEKNEKCVVYWPENRDTFGRFEIVVNNLKECDGYTILDLSIKDAKRSQSVKQYWYSSWPDHKTPETAQSLLDLIHEVEESRQAAGNRGPIVVHCSAGIGRTGCFIATSIGCQQIKETGEVDILGIVCQMRTDRGGMIQTSEQYQFLHQTLCLYQSNYSKMPDSSSASK